MQRSVACAAYADAVKFSMLVKALMLVAACSHVGCGGSLGGEDDDDVRSDAVTEHWAAHVSRVVC